MLSKSASGHGCLLCLERRLSTQLCAMRCFARASGQHQRLDKLLEKANTLVTNTSSSQEDAAMSQVCRFGRDLKWRPRLHLAFRI